MVNNGRSDSSRSMQGPMAETLKALLLRHEDLGICRISAEVKVHSGHDPAVLRTSHDFLRSYLRMAGTSLWHLTVTVAGRPTRERISRRQSKRDWRKTDGVGGPQPSL